MLMLVIPALGSLRQDDRTFSCLWFGPQQVPPQEKKRGQKTAPSRKAEEPFMKDKRVKAAPAHWILLPHMATVNVPPGWTQGCCLKPARHFLRAPKHQRGSV